MTQSLQITSPANGVTVKGTITVAVTAVDVGQVNFLFDGKYAGYDSSAPFSWTLDTTHLPDGAHTITVESGNGAVKASVAVTVANGVTPPPPPPPPPGTLFQDDFIGQAVSPPDPSKWYVISGRNFNGTPVAAANVFLDGNGHLVVRTARSGRGYTGGFLGTFNYTGWPTSGIKHSFALPFRAEMSALMPGAPGAHTGLWAMNVDRPTSQDIYELDIAEERMTIPTVAGSHQHTWLSGVDKHPVDASMAVTDMARNWHIYASEVYADHVTNYVDGKAVGSFYGVSGKFGLLLNNEIDPAGTWGAHGGQPAAGDPGPWDMLVDYVRVSAL